MTTPKMLFIDRELDINGEGYQAAAIVRTVFRGVPITTQRVAREMCTGEDAARNDLLCAVRLRILRQASGEAWVPMVR